MRLAWIAGLLCALALGAADARAEESAYAEEAAAFAQIPRGLRERMAVQLYTYRRQIAEDLPGTLAKIRAIGFRYVEAGPGAMAPAEFRAALDAADLRVAQTMVGLPMLRDEPETAIAFARAMDARDIGVAWIKTSGPETALTEAEVREAARIFNAACPAARAAGMRLFYHVHGYEFVPYGEGTLFDLLLDLVPPRCMDIQLDVFWAKYGGQVPADMIRRLGRRVTSLHLKDMAGDYDPAPRLAGLAPDETSVALGAGQVDIAAVVAEAKKKRVRWYIVEDESPLVDAQMSQSLRFLAGLRF